MERFVCLFHRYVVPLHATYDGAAIGPDIYPTCNTRAMPAVPVLAKPNLNTCLHAYIRYAHVYGDVDEICNDMFGIDACRPTQVHEEYARLACIWASLHIIYIYVPAVSVCECVGARGLRLLRRAHRIRGGVELGQAG